MYKDSNGSAINVKAYLLNTYLPNWTMQHPLQDSTLIMNRIKDKKEQRIKVIEMKKIKIKIKKHKTK